MGETATRTLALLSLLQTRSDWSGADLASRLVFSSGDLLSPEFAAFLTEAGRPVLPKPFDLSELARIVEEVYADAHAA